MSILPPLLYTAKFGYIKLAEKLLSKDVSVNLRDGTGRSALHFAAWFGYSKMISLLLNHQAVIDLTDLEYRTPLHYAAWFNHKDCCQVLIKSGAVLDLQDQGGRSPLHFAVFHGHLEIVQLLLSSGANFKLKTNEGKTADVIATSNGNNDIIAILQKAEDEYNKANPNGISSNNKNNGDINEGTQLRNEIMEEHDKMKRMISKLTELKELQFNECKSIKETLDNHDLTIYVFKQRQIEIMKQINSLYDCVQQAFNALDAVAAQKENRKDNSKNIPKNKAQSSGRFTFNIQPPPPPPPRIQHNAASTPTLVTNITSPVPSSNNSQTPLQLQSQSNQNSTSIVTSNNTSNSALPNTINMNISSNITPNIPSNSSNSKQMNSQNQANQRQQQSPQNTSQSKIQNGNSSSSKTNIKYTSNKPNIENPSFNGDPIKANKNFYYVDINNSSESNEKLQTQQQQQQQQKQRNPQIIMCKKCKVNPASYKCKICQSPICSSCCQSLKQNCPFCAQMQAQQNDNA